MRTLLLSAATLLLFSACSNETKQETSTQTTPPAKHESLVSDKVETIAQAKEVVKTLNTRTETAEAATEEITPPPAQSGASIYAQRCVSCHGSDAKKSALNSSKPIAGWSVQETTKALKGYQNGSYGGKMKAIMQAQSKPLSEDEIRRLAEYISVL